MARISKRKYTLQAMAMMVVYLLLMFFEWPLVRTAPSIALRAVLAVLPTIPVVIVIALAARKVMRGDELEQRLHLLSLSVTVAVISAASLIGGFLIMGHVWHVGGEILFWVFPALAFVYGATRFVLVRRITGSWDLWGC